MKRLLTLFAVLCALAVPAQAQQFNSVATEQARDICKHVNRYRHFAGLHLLRIQQTLNNAGTYKAGRIQAGEGRFFAEDARSPLERARIHNYQGETLGEFVAGGVTTGFEIVEKMWADPTGRALILDAQANVIGAGIGGSSFGLIGAVEIGYRLSAPIPELPILGVWPPELLPVDVQIFGPVPWQLPRDVGR